MGLTTIRVVHRNTPKCKILIFKESWTSEDVPGRVADVWGSGDRGFKSRQYDADRVLEQGLRPMQVCPTARDQIDRARLRRLRGDTSGDLDGHALLAQLKVAAALALLDEHTEINEEDWHLAGIVRAVSDRTRQGVINALAIKKAEQNHARGHAEADRAILVDQRRDEAARQRVGRSITNKLDREDDWVPHSVLRRSLHGSVREHFEDVIAALIESGQVEERATQADHAGHQGTEYRRAR